MTSEKDIQHLYLVDGSGFIFRAFHALPPLTRPDHTPINAVYGFTNMLIKLLADWKAEHFVIIFDAGRKNFRHDLYEDYKANRPPPPEELVPQFPLVRDVCKAFNVPTIEQEGFEADDLIATYAEEARRRNIDVTIVSSDKDLMQLIKPGIQMLDPLKNRAIGPNEVKEKFGVEPEKVRDLLALTGDKVDNIPGVPGIGIKTAAELITQYGTLNEILIHAEEIKQPKRRQTLIDHTPEARLSYELVHLKNDIPLTADIESFSRKEPDSKTLSAFLREQNFTATLARLEKLGIISEVPSDPADVIDSPAVQNYQVIQTEKELKPWIDRAYDRGILFIDTETTSLNAMMAELVGISLSVLPGEAAYLPLGHAQGVPQMDLLQQDKEKSRTYKQLPREKALDLLKPLLLDPSVLKVGHNLKYDLLVLKKYNIDVAPIDDTMVISYALEGGLHGHSLDELSQLHLAHTTIKFKEVVGSGKDQKTFADVPIEDAFPYACEDADIAGRLYRRLKPRLATESATTVYETLDRPLIKTLVRMESAGIKVNPQALQDLSKDLAKRLKAVEAEIHALAGHAFNIASPKQLGEVLFQEMGFEGGKKGKSGTFSTGADVLEDLAALGHDLPTKVLEWRMLAKLKNTYTDTLPTEINPKTGRIHTSYAMTGTSTGRLSSSDPNLQNIPVRTEEGRKIRRAFVAESGMRLVSLDYSQIELRLLAHVADIDALREAFHQNSDIHAMTASEVFGIPLKDIDSAHRSRAKAINFGIIYGISAFGLARQLRIPRSDAGAYIKTYLERYPEIPAYMEKCKAEAQENGYVRTILGRRCYVAGIKDTNPARRSFAERQAINAPLQGSAADIIKRAMIKIPPALEKSGLGAKMLLQVHDELIFEAPEDQVDQTTALAKQIMESVVSLSVPLTVDAKIAKNWGGEV